MTDSRLQLEYSPTRPRWLATRRARRLLMLLMLVVVVTAAAITKPQWSDWVHSQYAQAVERRKMSRCMTYEMPANYVVWERAPRQSAALLASPDYLQLRATNGSPLAVVAKISAMWQGFSQVNAAKQDSAIVFLHRRKFPGERAMIVAVEYCTGRGVGPHFAASLLEPGSFTRNCRFKVADVACRTEGVPMRITFGQADPDDESHFTVRAIAADGIEDVYDGWLGPPTFEWRPDELAKVRMTRRPRAASNPASLPPSPP